MKISITWFFANQCPIGYFVRLFFLTTLSRARNVARRTVDHYPGRINFHIELVTCFFAFVSITNHWARCAWWVWPFRSFHVLRLSFYVNIQYSKTHDNHFQFWYMIRIKQGLQVQSRKLSFTWFIAIFEIDEISWLPLTRPNLVSTCSRSVSLWVYIISLSKKNFTFPHLWWSMLNNIVFLIVPVVASNHNVHVLDVEIKRSSLIARVTGFHWTWVLNNHPWTVDGYKTILYHDIIMYDAQQFSLYVWNWSAQTFYNFLVSCPDSWVRFPINTVFE